MPEFCSCGAQLPPDALFCHKCGKPQRELVVPETVAPVVPLVVQAQRRPEPSPVNFRNGAPMRIAIQVAATATLLSFLPFLKWLAAGFFPVFFYRHKTAPLLKLRPV